MKKTFIVLAILSMASFISCEKTNDTDELPGMDDTSTGDPVFERLVDSEIISTTEYVSYSYLDGEGLLAQATQVSGSTSQEITVTYNDNGDVATYSTAGLSLNFEYDAEGNLISFGDVSISYLDNVAILTGEIEAELELNSDGRVSQMTLPDGYVEYTYNGGNVVGVDNFNLDGELIESYELSYDTNVNPFSGQFQSIYIERFLFAFYPPENGIGFGGYSGYNFPFLANNLTEISKDGTVILSLNYLYDDENYPTNVDAVDKNGETTSFSITYP